MGIVGEGYSNLFEMPWTPRGGLTTKSVGAPAPGNSSTNTAAGNSQRNGFSGDTSYQLVGRATILPFKDQNGNLIHTGVRGEGRTITTIPMAHSEMAAGSSLLSRIPTSIVPIL
ncbi:MAG: hypothetical protein ACRERU_06890 [Methylococcales bacterium]